MDIFQLLLFICFPLIFSLFMLTHCLLFYPFSGAFNLNLLRFVCLFFSSFFARFALLLACLIQYYEQAINAKMFVQQRKKKQKNVCSKKNVRPNVKIIINNFNENENFFMKLQIFFCLLCLGSCFQCKQFLTIFFSFYLDVHFFFLHLITTYTKYDLGHMQVLFIFFTLFHSISLPVDATKQTVVNLCVKRIHSMSVSVKCDSVFLNLFFSRSYFISSSLIFSLLRMSTEARTCYEA